jgi:hypothetical protein
MSDFKPTPPPKNALSEYKLTLSCPPAQGATKPGTLKFSVVKNNPRIDVYTNVPNDRNNGNIRAAMDSPTFYALLNLLQKVIDGPADQKYSIDNLNYTWFDGKRSEQPKVVSTTHVGRDKEGRVFIAVTAKERPYLKFVFLPSNFHAVKNIDGSPMSESELSTIYAQGYVDMLTELVANVLDTNYVEPEQRNNKPGAGNRNSYGGGQSKNNSQSASSDWDDEFPM